MDTDLTQLPIDPNSLNAADAVRSWEAQELDLAPRLRPMDISVDIQTECVHIKKEEHGPVFDIRSVTIEITPARAGVVCFAAGIRVFNGPREVIIESIRLHGAERGIYSAPFDAAAFQLEGPLPPLRADGKPYQGEPMRFAQQDLGAFAHDHPLHLTVRPWQAMAQGVPALGFPAFDALLFVHEGEKDRRAPV